MGRIWQDCYALCLSIVLLTSLCALADAQDRISAKIGLRIKSDASMTWAKTKDNVKAGDLLRLYVVPANAAYVYLVYSDNKTPVLLNKTTYKDKIQKGTAAVFPSESEFYRTDGANPFENFTIICSPHEMPEITTLFSSSTVSHEKWLSLENELIKRSRIDLSEKSEKPFMIAGNVRGLAEEKKDESLLNELSIFSGKVFLVKRYEMAVTK